MKLTIDRNTWLRGETDESKLLRSSDNKMCCLGFLALALNASKEEISDQSTPGTACSVKWLDGMLKMGHESHISNDLMRVNDSPNLSASEREAKLSQLFSQLGVEVEFIN